MDSNRKSAQNNEENAQVISFHKTLPFEGKSLTRYVLLEVVSKPQIRFKGPAWQRDFASDLLKLRCSARRDNPPHILADYWSLLSSLKSSLDKMRNPASFSGEMGF
jgi:hypothetical protein